jgi:hypothetical protein
MKFLCVSDRAARTLSTCAHCSTSIGIISGICPLRGFIAITRAILDQLCHLRGPVLTVCQSSACSGPTIFSAPFWVARTIKGAHAPEQPD